jgi:hypothetical protein
MSDEDLNRDDESPLVSNLRHALRYAEFVTDPPGDALGSVAFGTATALAVLARSDEGRPMVTGATNAMKVTAARDGSRDPATLLAIRILEAALSQE